MRQPGMTVWKEAGTMSLGSESNSDRGTLL
jgi:hypothetical protein